MRTLAAAILLLVVPGFDARAEDAPIPRLDRIDYGSPKAQIELGPKVGAGKRAHGIARQLKEKGKKPRATLAQIVRWVGRNLRLATVKAKTWRGVDQILRDGTVGGDADRALVIGALARAARIPAIWVKSVSVPWLRTHRRSPAKIRQAVGRVFLEVHLDGRWHLLDPTTASLYRDYDTGSPKMPHDHLAYDKGGDPYALVLPSRWSLWRTQLESHARSLPIPKRAWTPTHDLLAPWRVYITGAGASARYAREAAKGMGFLVQKSFSSGWEKNLGEARGKTLIVTMNAGTPNLPEKYWRTLLPPYYADVLSGARKLDKGFVRHKLRDGTRVIWVTAVGYGPVELAVSEALDR